MRGTLIVAVPLFAFVLDACASNDIGQPCPTLLGDTPPYTDSGNDTETETAEVVAYDPTFPCDELICIASAGRSGYCSKLCREDAACPVGFECREIQPVGDFAGKKFCAWRPCAATSDCGDKKTLCCREADDAVPVTATQYCDFADNGHCE